MLRGLIFASLLLALGAGGAPAMKTGGTPVAFVSAEKASVLVVVDLTTKRVLDRIRVPSGPRSVLATDDRFLLVTSPPSGKVTLVDSFTLRVVKTFGDFGYPNDVAVEGPYAYVTDTLRGELAVIELASRRIVARVAVGRRPVSVAAGDVALVTHGPAQPKLTIVDLRRPRAPRVIGLLSVPAEGGARDVSEQADSANAYITGWNSGGVGAIDWGNERVLWWRKVGALVQQVAFDYYHGRRLWVSDHRTGEVIALSSRDGRVLRRLVGCAGARQIAFGGRGQEWIAAACQHANALAVWDTQRWRRTLVSIAGRPHGVAVAVVP